MISGLDLTDFPLSPQAKEQGKAEAEDMITKMEKVVYEVRVIQL